MLGMQNASRHKVLPDNAYTTEDVISFCMQLRFRAIEAVHTTMLRCTREAFIATGLAILPFLNEANSLRCRLNWGTITPKGEKQRATGSCRRSNSGEASGPSFSILGGRNKRAVRMCAWVLQLGSLLHSSCGNDGFASTTAGEADLFYGCALAQCI